MRPITPAQHLRVITLYSETPSIRHVASKTGLGKSTVAEVVSGVEVDMEKRRKGRPPKLSEHNKRQILRQITTGRLDNASQATQFINPTLPHPVHPQTVRNALKKADYRSVVKRKCPLLKKVHCQCHLKFALAHQNWTVEDWKRVLWSDETKINRIASDGRVYTWKKKGEPLSDRTTTPTVKHGGGNNLMVWGCMGWNGVGKLVEVVGKMDSEQYCEILDEGVEESFEKLEMEEDERMFQQDNDPKHTSKRADRWFEDHNIDVLAWPAQSPDLNPIEHLWVHIKDQLKKYPGAPAGV
jgi:transposase